MFCSNENKEPHQGEYFVIKATQRIRLSLTNNNNNNDLIAFPLSGYSMLQMNNKLSLIN